MLKNQTKNYVGIREEVITTTTQFHYRLIHNKSNSERAKLENVVSENSKNNIVFANQGQNYLNKNITFTNSKSIEQLKFNWQKVGKEEQQKIQEEYKIYKKVFKMNMQNEEENIYKDMTTREKNNKIMLEFFEEYLNKNEDTKLNLYKTSHKKTLAVEQIFYFSNSILKENFKKENWEHFYKILKIKLEEYTKSEIIDAVLHLDEETPHFHLIFNKDKSNHKQKNYLKGLQDIAISIMNEYQKTFETKKIWSRGETKYSEDGLIKEEYKELKNERATKYRARKKREEIEELDKQIEMRKKEINDIEIRTELFEIENIVVEEFSTRDTIMKIQNTRKLLKNTNFDNEEKKDIRNQLTKIMRYTKGKFVEEFEVVKKLQELREIATNKEVREMIKDIYEPLLRYSKLEKEIIEEIENKEKSKNKFRKM
jgi:hypothetical protein